MNGTFQFEPDRGNVRTVARSHPLAYIVRELPARLEALAQDLDCPHDGAVLDYGCAEVPYRRFFPPTVEYIAADLPGNPDATLTIKADGTLPLHDGAVDVVLSTQVLEHVANPDLYLREAFRVLRPHGRLLLSTHGFMIYHPDPVDFWRWTSAGLREAVERAGFRVIRFEGIMGLGASGLQLLQDSILYRVPHRLRRVLGFAFQTLIASVDRREPPEARNLNALVFGLIGERP